MVVPWVITIPPRAVQSIRRIGDRLEITEVPEDPAGALSKDIGDVYRSALSFNNSHDVDHIGTIAVDLALLRVMRSRS
jgi:hypothetical protein